VPRTAGYRCLLVGAMREITSSWTAWASIARVEDLLRHLARKLHDGVLQELSWIKSEAGALSCETGSAVRVNSIIDDSDRALDDARAASMSWGATVASPWAYVPHRSARDVAERHGARVVVDLADSRRES
jgi:hypothetical protein